MTIWDLNRNKRIKRHEKMNHRQRMTAATTKTIIKHEMECKQENT